MAALKLATYNINGIRTRLRVLLEWLARESPDIVCLQELKAEDAVFPAAELRASGYAAVWHGQKSWNGVAILARGAAPLVSRRGLPDDPDATQSRYIEAAVRGMVVGCLYLPNGNPQPGPKFDYKLAWFDRLIAHAAGLLRGGFPAILAGDFNVVPTDLDIYDTRSWKRDALLQPEARQRYQKLLAQGWLDALRSKHPDAPMYTFWDYFRQHWQRDAGLRIDHLLLSPGVAPRLIDAGVDRWVRGLEGTSDHAPTWITFTGIEESDLSDRAAAPARRAKKTAAKKTAAKKKPAAKKKTARRV